MPVPAKGKAAKPVLEGNVLQMSMAYLRTENPRILGAVRPHAHSPTRFRRRNAAIACSQSTYEARRRRAPVKPTAPNAASAPGAGTSVNVTVMPPDADPAVTQVSE